MISWNKKLTRGVLIGTMGLLIAAVGACKLGDSDPLKWTEDVKLPDGRIVTLTRYQEFKGPHEIGDTPTESDYWFELKHPDTGELVRWVGKRNLKTLALFADKSNLYLLATPWYGDAEFYFNSPNPPYLLYRYDKKWMQIQLGSIPVKLIRVNMTFAPKEKRESINANHHIDAVETSNSYHKNRPYLINFNRMSKQTFGDESIGHYDDLVD